MESRESVGNVSADSMSHRSPNSSSPLRKKKNQAQNISSTTLVENNDEAERLARRQEISNARPAVNLSKNDRRHSLGLSFLSHMSQLQLNDRITQCIKLSAENKINAKNAFSMEIIDFMTYMIKKQDANMTNLQVASTSLDVSTKIYGFRVDGIHTQLLQMMGGLDKQDKKDEPSVDGSDAQTDAVQEDEDNGQKKQPKKKKKRSRQRIFATVDNLRGKVETAEPSLLTIGEGDTQTTDMLRQVSLPNHANSGFHLQMYNDVIVDTIEQKEAHNRNTVVSIPRVENFSQLEMCPSLPNFDFHGWTQDDEPEENHESQPEPETDNRFQFDLDASLPIDDEPADDCDINYFDMENEDDNVDKCVQVPTAAEKIVDLQKVVTTTKLPNLSEYSFLQKNTNRHWAGPSHWKLSSFKRVLGNSRVVETCHQGPARKKKEIEVRYDNEKKESVMTKFTLSHAIKLQAKHAKVEWHEWNITLPRDMHYDISSAKKLYVHILLTVNHGDKDGLDTTHISDVLHDYNYDNDNDTSNYCPDVVNEEENNDEDMALETQGSGEFVENGGFTGDNLISVPTLTNKISIAYSTRAKRIDMQQLKRSIWKNLISTGNKENLNIQEAVAQETANKMEEEKHFSDIYKNLPNTLSKTNIEALSFPISFVSLLHLANEKILNIKSLPDMSDIVIKGN